MSVLIMAVSVCASSALRQPTANATPAQQQSPPTSQPAKSQPSGSPTSAPADSQPSDALASPTLTTQIVQARIDELTASTNLDQAVRDQALDMYRTALGQLEIARASAESAATMRQSVESAPRTAAALREQLQQFLATPEPPPQPETLPEAQDLLNAQQVALADVRSKLKTLEDSLRALSTRPDAARKELTAEKQRLEELERSRDTAPSAADPTVIAEARPIALAARILAKTRQIDLLEQELLSLPARQDQLTAERDLAAAQAAALDKRVTVLQSVVNERRAQEARKQQEEAERVKRELAGKHPVLAAYAATNAELSQTLIELTERVGQTTRDRAEVKSQVDQLNEIQVSADQVLGIAADDVFGAGRVGRDFGELLRELRQRLPRTSRLRADLATRERAILDDRLRRLRVLEELRSLNDANAAVARLLNVTDDSPADPQVEGILRELMNSRRDTLSKTAEMYAQHIELLSTMNSEQRTLRTESDALALRLNEELLWLPSAAPIGRAWLEHIAAGSKWIASPSNWGNVGEALLDRLGHSPVMSVLLFITFTGLLGTRKVLRMRLAGIAESVGRVISDSFFLTPRAFLISTLLALPWPLLLAYLGWVLVREETGPTFTFAVGMGLLRAAAVLMVLDTIRQMCIKNGLFNVHFGWSQRACQTLGSNLRWMSIILVAAAVVVAMMDASGEESYRDGLGRLAFIIASIALTIFMYRILHPRRGAVAEFLSGGGAIWKMRGVWFTLLTAAPAALGVLAAYGYYEPASQVQERLFTSTWVCLFGLVLYSFAMRWVLVAHRRLAVMQAREKRDKAQALAAAKQAAEASGEAMPQALEVGVVDLSSVSQQTRTLLRVFVGGTVLIVLWLVWSKLVPALGVLDRVTLWSHWVPSDQGEQLVPVTLWSVASGLGILGLTILAIRNVPGLLEITLLQRFNINAGSRYAIAAVCRYVIIAVGVIIAFGRIGVDWSKLQWIVAALGVGLGFGLQEIVANFVSGLIILFEQPVRVGDLVTVGDLTGTVSRIHIRGTTIIDPDNREIIVPNKSIITDRVINWALSDPVTRLVVKVGIAYGSDTTLAHRVLLETAKANPLVLNSPPPTVFFLGFGDSSLDFEVRVYVREIATRIPILHELHMAIERALRENKIEIPFPQRDLHLRSAEGVLHIGGTGAKPANDESGSGS